MSKEERKKIDEDSSRVKNITFILVPFEISGSFPFACAHFLYLTDTNTKHDLSWQKAIDYYNAIDQKLKRSLRRGVKELYIKSIRDIFYENFIQLLLQNNYIDDLSVIEKKLNTDLGFLEQYLPFDVIELKLYYTDSFLDENNLRDSVRSLGSIIESNSGFAIMTNCFSIIKNKIGALILTNPNSYFPIIEPAGRKHMKQNELVSVFTHEVRHALMTYSVSSGE